MSGGRNTIIKIPGVPSGIPGICTGRITLSYVLKGKNRGMLISAATAVIKTIQKLIGFLLSFHAVYFITGLFTTRKFPPAKKQHKYAVLVAARNEEKVIGRQESHGRGERYAMSGRIPTTGQRGLHFSIL